MPNRDSWIWPLGVALRHRRPGPDAGLQHAPELATTGTLRLTSTAFAHGGSIARRHSAPGRGANVSPQLSWRDVPAGTAELLLVMEDVDVPADRPGLHLAALLPPDRAGLAEGELTADSPGIRWIPARRGRTGYRGPRPIPGHGDHRYGFHLFALDRAVPDDVLRSATAAAQDAVAAGDRWATAFPPLLPWLAGHVLAHGFLEGLQRG